jgi:hypothetical protein
MKVTGGVLVLLLAGFGTAHAQQLEPRAYTPSPVGLHYVGTGMQYSFGGVVTDPTIPIKNVDARVYALPAYYGQTLNVFGRMATASLAVPYGWAHIEGDIQETSRSVDRCGFLDPALRLGINLIGCPALTPQEFAARTFGTTMGASLTVSIPFGQYDPSKLINLGTNRWAFKPEMGASHPIGAWAVEAYAGVWLFAANDEFYGGKVRTQRPLGSYQAHVVYKFTRSAWASANLTYYSGGATTLDGVDQHDRQDNTRGGLTVSFPCGKNQSVRATWAQGVSTRFGSSFQTIGVGWQLRWF